MLIVAPTSQFRMPVMFLLLIVGHLKSSVRKTFDSETHGRQCNLTRLFPFLHERWLALEITICPPLGLEIKKELNLLKLKNIGNIADISFSTQYK
jgi:hypothetical protein